MPFPIAVAPIYFLFEFLQDNFFISGQNLVTVLKNPKEINSLAG